MLKWFLHRQTRAFERPYGYDASYIHQMIDADPRAAMAFYKIMPLTRYRRDAPRDVLAAAGLAASMAEDCGPCTQLGVKMAEEAGVSNAVLEAVVAGNLAKMPADVALGYRFAKAVLQHAPEADTLRAEVVRRWGERALVSLAFAITTARIFPTVKYALGHGQACMRVRVGGRDLGVERQAA
jgi:hypothetical protein